ncbi:hypothetical protein Nepgr_007506 [Nepenthes gracilis]|uniref:DUF4408 domain-containing protein n=1 Tax=Nepenthes gracilis TaxID=150966 RepID=A0AAD3S7C7_NEPGR|nr:hypothetical protein Nepgr_007506 [Nepenthes gracilis]
MVSGWLLSVKLVLISTAVLSMAVIFKLSVPIMLDFLTIELPVLWSSLLSWLRPPYLYLVLNCIILTIVASSKLHQPDKSDGEVSPEETDLRLVPIKIESDLRFSQPAEKPIYEREGAPSGPIVFGYIEHAAEKRVSEMKPMTTEEENTTCGGGEEFVISRSTWTPLKRDAAEYSSISSEKPLVSARFGYRKAAKASPEAGKALGVSKPRRQDTLEATWRTITEGRPMPLTRHLRKSDTWESNGRRRYEGPHDSSPAHVMKKSETFSDRAAGGDNNTLLLSPSPGGLCKQRREPSPSQDELNRRVEAFIKKFNEEMRLQRQESLNQYREMIGHGAH